MAPAHPEKDKALGFTEAAPTSSDGGFLRFMDRGLVGSTACLTKVRRATIFPRVQVDALFNPTHFDIGNLRMQIDLAPGLEQALAEIETAADVTLAAAKSVTAALKKVKAAAKVGKLRDLRRAIESAERAIIALKEQFENTRDGWDFDEENYLDPQGGYIAELLAAAEEMGVRVYERDQRLHCPPMLLRVLPSDRCVLIDKRREHRLRPSVLAEVLRRRQAKPPRFRAIAFLESLYKAYTIACKTRAREAYPSAPVIALVEIYNLLTLLPGQPKEYPREDFARDLYLLDRSGQTTTSKRYIVSFHASTGTKSAGKTLWTIDEEGTERVYFGIRFSSEEQEILP